VDIPEPDYSDSDDDDAVDDEIQLQLITAKKLVNPCVESKEHQALRRELAFNQKLYACPPANTVFYYPRDATGTGYGPVSVCLSVHGSPQDPQQTAGLLIHLTPLLLRRVRAYCLLLCSRRKWEGALSDTAIRKKSKK